MRLYLEAQGTQVGKNCVTCPTSSGSSLVSGVYLPQTPMPLLVAPRSQQQHLSQPQQAVQLLEALSSLVFTAAVASARDALWHLTTKSRCSRSSTKLEWARSHTSSTKRIDNHRSLRAKRRLKHLKKAKSEAARRIRPPKQGQALRLSPTLQLWQSQTTLSSSYSSSLTTKSAGRSTRALIDLSGTKTQSTQWFQEEIIYHRPLSKAKSSQKESVSTTASGSSTGQRSSHRPMLGTAIGASTISRPWRKYRYTTSHRS